MAHKILKAPIFIIINYLLKSTNNALEHLREMLHNSLFRPYNANAKMKNLK